MSTKDYGQTFYPLGSDGVDIDDYFEQLAESLEGRTVVSFTSLTAWRTARDTYLTTAQKKGNLAHIQGLGLYYYTGTVERRVGGDTFMQSGITNVTVQPTGLALISFPSAFGGVPNVTVSHSTAIQSAPPRLVRLYTETSYLTTTTFHVHVVKPDGTAAGGEGIDIAWTAVGARVAD